MSQPNEKPSNAKKFATALEFLEQIKKVFYGLNKPNVYTDFLLVMQDFKSNTAHLQAAGTVLEHNDQYRSSTQGVVRRVKELFRGHPQLILGFNSFLPPNFQISEEELRTEEEQRNRIINLNAIEHQHVLDTARQYVQKIKTRFANEPHIYKAFLEVLFQFKNDKTSVNAVHEKITVLFKNHPDLIEEFNQFLNDVDPPIIKPDPPKRAQEASSRQKPNANAQVNESAQPAQAKATRQKRQASLKPNLGVEEESLTLVNNEDLELFEVIKKALKAISIAHWNDCLKVLEMYNLGIIGRKETISLLYQLLGDGDVFEKLRTFMHISKDDFEKFKNITFSTGINVDEDDEDSLDDEEEEEEEKRTRIGSYIYEEDDGNTFSGQTDLDKKVLNNHWVSQPPRDDYRFKASPKNIYEENLFECEDGRYEMDLLLEKNMGLRQTLGKLDTDWKSKTLEERSSFPLQDLLGVINFEYLKGLYGPESDEVLRLLVEHPSSVIPVMVSMLFRKEIEMHQKKDQFSEKWKIVCVENSLKSLDHRGQYFKDQEAFNLKARNILARINDSYKKRQATINLEGQPDKKFDLIWTKKDFILYSSLKELLLEAKNAFFSKSLTIYLLNKENGSDEKKEEKKEVSQANEVEMKKVDHLLLYIENFLSCCLNNEFGNGMAVENNNNNGNKNNGNDNNNNGSKVFYADKNLVVLWRYFEILLDQIHIAWNFEPSDSDHVKFKQHMQHMVLLMNGKMEAAIFEEKCISLFGASSYFLFSADTLLDAIFKYMKLILSDSASGELCCNLIQEFLNKKNDKEYQENCTKLLKSAHQPLYEIVISAKYVDNNNNNDSTLEVSGKEGNSNNNKESFTDGEKVKTLKRSAEVLNGNESDRATKKSKLNSTKEFQITIQQLF